MPIRRISAPIENGTPGPGDAQHIDAGSPVSFDDVAFSDRGQRYFADVQFPATRDDIYASAVAHHAPRRMLDAIRNLPDAAYQDPDALPNLYALANMGEHPDARD